MNLNPTAGGKAPNQPPNQPPRKSPLKADAAPQKTRKEQGNELKNAVIQTLQRDPEFQQWIIGMTAQHEAEFIQLFSEGNEPLLQPGEDREVDQKFHQLLITSFAQIGLDHDLTPQIIENWNIQENRERILNVLNISRQRIDNIFARIRLAMLDQVPKR